MAQLVPPTEQRLACDGPSTVEVVIREQENEQILCLVNIAPGKRQRDAKVQPFLRLEIKELPPAPPCRVTLRAL